MTVRNGALFLVLRMVPDSQMTVIRFSNVSQSLIQGCYVELYYLFCSNVHCMRFFRLVAAGSKKFTLLEGLKIDAVVFFYTNCKEWHEFKVTNYLMVVSNSWGLHEGRLLT